MTERILFVIETLENFLKYMRNIAIDLTRKKEFLNCFLLATPDTVCRVGMSPDRTMNILTGLRVAVPPWLR